MNAHPHAVESNGVELSITLKSLNDLELHEATVSAAKTEKAATLFLLLHLLEMDNRRAFVPRGADSIWSYVEGVLGYSSAQTSERVSALRLLQKVPEATNLIQSGELSMTSAASLGRHIKAEQKTQEEAVALVAECAGKSSREVERILLPDTTAPKPDQVKAVSKEKTRISIEVDEEFMQLLNRAKELGRDPTATPQKVFERALREFTKKREVKEPARARAKENKKESEKKDTENSASETWAPKPGEPSSVPEEPAELSVPKNRYIPAETKRALRKEAGDQCMFHDPVTERRCECRTGLEIHHHQAYAYGGSHSLENLSLFCRAHHALFG